MTLLIEKYMLKRKCEIEIQNLYHGIISQKRGQFNERQVPVPFNYPQKQMTYTNYAQMTVQISISIG